MGSREPAGNHLRAENWLALRNRRLGFQRHTGETRDTESRTEFPPDTIGISLGDDNFVLQDICQL